MAKKIKSTFVENEKQEIVDIKTSIEDVKEVNYPIIVERDDLEEQEDITVEVTLMKRTGDVEDEND